MLMLYGVGDVRTSMGHRWNDDERGKADELGRETCSSDTSCTTNPTFTDLVLNPGLHVGMLIS
jgi:hypothetical protein